MNKHADHLIECINQNTGTSWNNYNCVCDSLNKEYKEDQEANNGETEFLGR